MRIFYKQFFYLLTILIIALCLAQQTSSKEAKAKPVTGNSLMQCMEKCLKYEGNISTAKSTCKMRCAEISIQNNSIIPNTDCMGLYKKCRQICPKKNKICRRKCKETLNQCS